MDTTLNDRGKKIIKHFSACQYQLLNGIFDKGYNTRKDPRFGYRTLDYVLCKNFDKHLPSLFVDIK